MVIVVLSLITALTLGFATNTIALSAQDYGASQHEVLVSPVTSATVTLNVDGTGKVNQCKVTLAQAIANGGSVTCVLKDASGNTLTQGTWTCSATTGTNQGPCSASPTVLTIVVTTPQSPGLVSKVKIIAIDPPVSAAG